MPVSFKTTGLNASVARFMRLQAADTDARNQITVAPIDLYGLGVKLGGL